MTKSKQAAEEISAISRVVALRRADDNGDEQWGIIRRLHASGGAHILKRCLAMCKSAKAEEREVAADILGQLGKRGGEVPFRDKSIEALTPLLKDENENVVDSAITALGHMRASDAILSNVHLATHSSDLIRYSMALSLGFLDSTKARRALIRLSADDDTDVRNWATFGLGTQSDNDTKEIRAALFARIEDPDDETRNEAILGLARRKIRDVIPVLVRELETEPDNPSPLAIEATEELLAKEFLMPLKKILEAYGDPDGAIKDAINKIESQ